MSQAQPFEFRSPHRIRKIESHTRSWNGITVRNIVHYPDPGKAWHDLSSRETTVAIVLGQVGGYCEPRLNLNRPTLRSRFDAGHTTFVPADMTVWGYTDGLRSVRELRMSFAPKVPESILGDDVDSAKTDTESLTTALTAALFTRRNAQRQRANGLSRWQLRRAMEYLEAHMTEDMSLEEMARLVGLSQSQFARSFKLSTGMPPYKWSLDARIKRAQELLLLGKESIAFIALQTGFADQSHFTKTFRRATGVTPKDWQRRR